MFQSKRVSLDLTSALPSAGVFIQHGSDDEGFEPGLPKNDSVLGQPANLHEKKVKRKVCKMKKRQMKTIHKVLNSPGVCNNCFVYKYHYHKESHPITKRVATYTGCEKEAVDAITVSSYVCVECSRGPQSQKVLSGKFVKFGRIQNFILHCTGTLSNIEDSLAHVKWINNVSFDEESGLWFVRQSECDHNQTQQVQDSSYISTKELSPPLVVAEEDGNLWFLNSNKKIIQKKCVCK